MVIDPNIKEKAERFIEELQKHKIRILSAFIYGSYAKGTARKDSDIDLALISSDFSGNRYLDSMKIIPFRRKIDNRIEPVTFRPEDFDEIDPLAAEIKNNSFKLK
ncbi:MAG: nucleotidyltransferase [Candidatus Saganbacteria bacterium]|uniref:Nucleotidyltransferase n=1 Tax=Candidatus Saganbacteria bacterium TaxID=2575572 RepID=A0A833L256_UNCSA|nr:MAG: nucleotidyltransferase [Candidatus Saganbacteria bacterium]